MNIYAGMINGTLNRTTNLLVLLIVTSFILPATEIMYASGFTENNAAPPSGFTENNAAPPSGFTENNAAPPSGFTENNAAPPSGFTENNAAPPSGFTENNAAPPSGFRLSNNTGNAYCDSCNNDIYNGSGDLKDMVLAVQNRERAAVGVQPLVWSDKLAADAKPYAEHLLTTAELEHPSQEWVDTHPNSLPGYEGENLAWRGNTTTVPMAQMQQGWISEKNDYHGQLISNDWSPGDPLIGHYTQMVWNTTTQVGCATSSGGPYGRDVLDCRYSPVGNIVGQKPY
jgi:uncharacterized protein YkwD